ncbi:AraC family transcriptional regulator [Aestuariicella sp. G3-2]|uniref:helix-turn-helix domain-containing protein n=1 Tax=Pseudomaricurvus albidus TaxID=2842452 RepID=UPI001C0B65A2|nr:AraC family transcriptional regulator [Aestuariicella albida]MBU3068418.1 AraC family transcriptional regulator [Aestuariicella albida]
MSEQALPVFYINDKRSLYLGRSPAPLREIHSGNPWFAICLQGQLRFRANGHDEWITAKSLLASAGTQITIDNRNSVSVAIHLDPAKPDFAALKSFMQPTPSGVYCHHTHEEQLIKQLLDLREKEPDFDTAQACVEELIYGPLGERRNDLKADPRIEHVIQRIRDTSAENLSVKQLAKEVGMSESGLIKLFRKNVGAPIRKHRLWCRLINFITFVMAGKSIPQATTLAGFSDASHLSKCYSSLMGVPVSIAFARTPTIKCVISDENLARAEQMEPKSERLPVDPREYFARLAMAKAS